MHQEKKMDYDTEKLVKECDFWFYMFFHEKFARRSNCFGYQSFLLPRMPADIRRSKLST